MNNKNSSSTGSGFTLLEMLIYLGIFITTTTFIIGIFFTFAQVNQRQTSVNEVNRQISFVNNIVQSLVRDSSLVEMSAGVSTSTLTLRTKDTEKTLVWHDADNQRVMLQEGSGDPVALTDENVKVSNFSVVKLEQPGSFDIVQIGMTIDFNTENPREEFRRSVNLAISRATAATFDSNVLPNASGLQVGDAGNRWDGFFSKIGLGSASLPASDGMNSSADIAFTTSTVGAVLRATDGSNCFRITVNNAGELNTTGVSCP